MLRRRPRRRHRRSRSNKPTRLPGLRLACPRAARIADHGSDPELSRSTRRWHTGAMAGPADDELAGQLADLTRRLRDQLVHHVALGAWAAPGGPTVRTAVLDEPAADDESSSAAPVNDH